MGSMVFYLFSAGVSGLLFILLLEEKQTNIRLSIQNKRLKDGLALYDELFKDHIKPKEKI